MSKEEDVVPAFYKALDAYPEIDSDSHFIQWIFNRLQLSQSTTANIADIALASGFSHRRVEQKFKTLIGLRAKEMQRILQLRQLMDGFDISLDTTIIWARWRTAMDTTINLTSSDHTSE